MEYSKEELEVIRESLKKYETTVERALRAVEDPCLRQKIQDDKLVALTRGYSLFPESYRLFYESSIMPKVRMSERADGSPIAIFLHPEKSIVIKPVLSSREAHISNVVDELNVGPRQYSTIDGFITEEYLDGKYFTFIRHPKEDELRKVGQRVGNMFSRLHSKDIYFNNDVLCNDRGRTHLIVPENAPAMLFNFSRSFDLDSRLSREEVESLSRQTSGRLVYLGEDDKERLLNKDVDRIVANLALATKWMGDQITEPFLDGFWDSYR